jgi:hypothetical protein
VKIGVPVPPARRQPGPAQPPLLIDDMGCCRAVVAAPSSDSAWVALTERLPAGGGYLAARLTACLSRVDDATAATAKGLAAIGEKTRAGELVPASWVSRLADLEVEWLESLWALDDAAHQAAVEPRWVEVAPGERAIPAEETSWARVSRIVARELQQISQMQLPDDLYEQWCALDVSQPCAEGDVEGVKAKGRAAIRWAIHAHYGQEETM